MHLATEGSMLVDEFVVSAEVSVGGVVVLSRIRAAARILL
jgi:hypothetical protein